MPTQRGLNSLRIHNERRQVRVWNSPPDFRGLFKLNGRNTTLDLFPPIIFGSFNLVQSSPPPPLSQILNSSVFLSCNEIFYLSAAFIFHATSTTRISLLAPYVTALYGNVIFAASISCSTPDSSRISFTTFPFSLTTSFDLFPVAT